MKKTILFLMALLMTSLAFGQLAEVSTTVIGTHTFNNEADAVAVSDGIDLFMFGGDGDDNFKIYNISEGTSTVSTATPILSSGESFDCSFYNNKIYCLARQGTNISAQSIDLDGSNYQNLTSYAVGEYISPDCDLRPSTDEIWCVDLGNNNTADGVYKYDIGENTITKVYSGNPYSFRKNYQQCIFRDDDEIWCVGAGITVPYTDGDDAILVYSISGNSFDVTKTMQVYMKYVGCNWFEDILYCYGGYYLNDPNECNSDIYYYDPSTDTAGNITDVLPVDICIGDSAVLDTDTVVYLGGYELPSWDYYMGVFTIDFVSTAVEEEVGLEPYEPMHTTGDVVGVVTDFAVEFGIQAIALAGLVALVGLAVWIRWRFK